MILHCNIKELVFLLRIAPMFYWLEDNHENEDKNHTSVEKQCLILKFLWLTCAFIGGEVRGILPTTPRQTDYFHSEHRLLDM